jgi:hypothetical protein
MEGLSEYKIPYLISNTVFLLSVYAALKKPLLARIFFILLFLWASYTNFTTALNTPEAYLEYGKLSLLKIYEDIISGYFADHTPAIVSAIAFLQFIIAALLTLEGYMFDAGCIGGIIFGLAIAPLGVGSAFPSTVFMAIALFILIKKYKHYYIWNLNQYAKQAIISKTGNGK